MAFLGHCKTMRTCRFSCVVMFLGCFLSTVLDLTECAQVKITVEKDTTMIIDSSATTTNSGCNVCINQNCQSSVILKSDTLVDFNCSQPEKVFKVQIVRNIAFAGWTKNIQPKILPKILPDEYPAFQKFNRTFTWNLKSDGLMNFSFNFTSMGLKQIHQTDSCPDEHIYTFTSVENIVGSFCQKGSIRHVEVRNPVRLSLNVNGGKPLEKKVIIVSVKSTSNSLAHITVDFKEKSSPLAIFSPKYPSGFPSKTDMLWTFTVPPSYYTSVFILNYTLPKCLKPSDTPIIEYNWIENGILKTRLNDEQPSMEPGNFTLTLRNCEIFQQNMSQKGLTVHIEISTKSQKVGHCQDPHPLKEMQQMRVRRHPKSACVMKSGWFTMDTVTIASGNLIDLYFFDCKKEEVELTVIQTIECKSWQNCTNTPSPLQFSYDPPCIYGVLKTMTWHLHGPESSSVELVSPNSGLCYSLPEKKCNSEFLLDVSHDNRSITVGQFCPKGPIQNININKSSIDITVSCTATGDHCHPINPIINYLFRKEISAHYIFTVEAKSNYAALLATPAWPSGMTPSNTVSWIVNLEPLFEGKLEFKYISQPKCKEVRTSITVQSINSQKMLYSTKKDDKIKDLQVLESFYLNMTNCKPITGDFRAMMQITVQSNYLYLKFILSVVGIILVVIITFVVVCFVIGKKKRNSAPPVSIYNPGEQDILPGLRIPIALDLHIYEVIEEKDVYSNLPNLNEQSTKSSGPPLPERPIRKGPTTNHHNMIDNELYS